MKLYFMIYSSLIKKSYPFFTVNYFSDRIKPFLIFTVIVSYFY
jgi:hypothetical protein